MRITDDVRTCVAFVGHMVADERNELCFVPGATGFFLLFDGATYFVTARHVASRLEGPFALRASQKDGSPILFEDVEAGWFHHPNPNVDISVVVGLPDGAFNIAEDLFATPDAIKRLNIGIGNETHVVGLYRLMYGANRNLPIVHTGHIAMVPEDEPIPMLERGTGKIRLVNGYLVEAQTLEGLSGAPVFVRNSWRWNQGDQTALLSGDILLLGMWLGAWDAPPGDVLSLERPEAKRVPVGMGVVLPLQTILEFLMTDEIRAHRKKRLADEKAASFDSDIPVKPVENPRHKEDFTRLLNAAAKRREPTD